MIVTKNRINFTAGGKTYNSAFRTTPDLGSEIKQFAEQSGKSINLLLNEAIVEKLERESRAEGKNREAKN